MQRADRPAGEHGIGQSDKAVNREFLVRST